MANSAMIPSPSGSFEMLSSGGRSFTIPVSGQRLVLPTKNSTKYQGHNEYTTVNRYALSMPTGFVWNGDPVDVSVTIDTVNSSLSYFSTSVNVKNYEITGKTYYVNASTGNDANNGLTAGAPLANIATALAKSDVDVISLSPGTYTRNSTGVGCGIGNVTKLTPTRNVSIICPSGRAVISMKTVFPTWTKHGTYTNVYYVARSFIGRVFDLTRTDTHGDYTELTKKASISEVNNTLDSWYTDSTNVYVRTHDDAVPGSDMCLFYCQGESMSPIYNANGKTIYCENIDFEGGDTPVYMSNGGSFYAKNCTFKYSTTGNGLSCLGTHSILDTCVAAKNRLDGFNYHILNTTVCYAVEISCIGRDNGVLSEIAASNGSTIHDNAHIIRINGTYCRNHGPNMADVLGSQSWNLRCEANNSTCTDHSTTDADFYGRTVSNGARNQMWLDSCTSTSSRSFYPIYNDSECDLYQSSSISGDINNESQTVYEFSDLTDLSNPWIALISSTNDVTYFVFTDRPKNISYIRDSSGDICGITIDPGNAIVYRGSTYVGDQLTDTDADGIPDILEESVTNSIANVLQFNSFNP